jgi:hypothetical protein
MAKEGLIPDISFELPIDSFLWGLLPGHGPSHPGPICPINDWVIWFAAVADWTAHPEEIRQVRMPRLFQGVHEDLGPLLRKIHGSDDP